MQIHQADPDDLSAVLRLCSACKAHMISNCIDQWDDLYPSESVFRRDIAAGELYLYRVTRGEAGGCIVLNTYQDPEYAQIAWNRPEISAAVIHRLMVRPELEGTGVAAGLLRFAEHLAFRQGFGAVRLDMFRENPRAVAFYQKHGYQLRGCVRFRKGEFYCADKLLTVSA